jgi:hypothetical protein
MIGTQVGKQMTGRKEESSRRIGSGTYLHVTKIVPLVCDGDLALYNSASDALSERTETRR